MLTQNWGVYVDVKKLIYLNPNFQGDLLNTGIHIRTLGKIDPWVAGDRRHIQILAALCSNG